jgi:subtilisin family serine protease
VPSFRGRVQGVLCFAFAVASVFVGCSRTPPLSPPSASGDASSPDAAIGVRHLLPPRDVLNEVVVTLADGANAVQLALDYGAIVTAQYDGYASLLSVIGENAPSLAGRLARDVRVVTSEVNAFLEPSETRQHSVAFDDGTGTAQIYMNQPSGDAATLGTAHRVTNGAGVTIAILDTGAELTHPALAGHVTSGFDFVDGDNNASETADGQDNDGDGAVDEAMGHGTHVTGIVALAAPEARLVAVRVLDADGRGDVLSVAAGVHWAATHGARVINMSLGMYGTSPAIESALLVADRSGVVCIAAAGNDGGETPVEYPASSSHVLAVAAVDDADRAADFTSFGNFVALSAPGVDVWSAYTDGTYALWSGTSMSAPFVSGTAALLLSVHPSWEKGAVRQRLAESARDLGQRNAQLAGKLGAGALDAGAALEPDRRVSVRGGVRGAQ